MTKYHTAEPSCPVCGSVSCCAYNDPTGSRFVVCSACSYTDIRTRWVECEHNPALRIMRRDRVVAWRTVSRRVSAAAMENFELTWPTNAMVPLLGAAGRESLP